MGIFNVHVDGTVNPDTIDLPLNSDFDITVDALAGNDTVSTGAGDDTLYGREGDDVLSGRGGDDLLEGNDGDDTLDGGAGIDQLHGGDGDDKLRYDAADSVVDGGENTDASDDFDTVEVDPASNGVFEFSEADMTNIEQVDLGSGPGNAFHMVGMDLPGLLEIGVRVSDVDSATDGNNMLVVSGDANDSVNLAAGEWNLLVSDVAVIPGSAETYDIYDAADGSGSMIAIDSDISV